MWGLFETCESAVSKCLVVYMGDGMVWLARLPNTGRKQDGGFPDVRVLMVSATTAAGSRRAHVPLNNEPECMAEPCETEGVTRRRPIQRRSKQRKP